MDDKSTLVICKTCGKPIRASRLEDHQRRDHSKKVTKTVIEKRTIKVRQNLRKEEKSQHAVLVKCPVCSVGVSVQALDTHLSTEHSMKRTEGGVRKKSPQWSGELSRGDAGERSWQDVYDRGLVYSGGAFGLGRKR